MTPLIICCRNNRASENFCKKSTKCSEDVNFKTLDFFLNNFLPDLITIIVFHLL